MATYFLLRWWERIRKESSDTIIRKDRYDDKKRELSFTINKHLLEWMLRQHLCARVFSHCTKKWSFSLRISSVNETKFVGTADLVTLAEEIFKCSCVDKINVSLVHWLFYLCKIMLPTSMEKELLHPLNIGIITRPVHVGNNARL